MPLKVENAISRRQLSSFFSGFFPLLSKYCANMSPHPPRTPPVIPDLFHQEIAVMVKMYVFLENSVTSFFANVIGSSCGSKPIDVFFTTYLSTTRHLLINFYFHSHSHYFHFLVSLFHSRGRSLPLKSIIITRSSVPSSDEDELNSSCTFCEHRVGIVEELVHPERKSS